MNVSEMVTYVRRYLDLEAQDMATELIARWAAEGQRQVLNSRPRWLHLESSVSVDLSPGVALYPLANLRTISSVDCPTVGPLAVVDEAEAKARYWTSGDARQARPECISRWGNTDGVAQFRVWPLPDAEYTLELLGQRAATAPTSTTEPDLPEDLHDAVLEWVMQKAYLHQDDFDAAAIHKRLFDSTLSAFADREDDDEDSSPRVFGGGFGSGTRRQVQRDDHWTPSFGELGT